jgi:hypothetical protein
VASPGADVPDLDSAGEETASRLKAFARGTLLGRDSDNTEGPQNQ